MTALNHTITPAKAALSLSPSSCHLSQRLATSFLNVTSSTHPATPPRSSIPGFGAVRGEHAASLLRLMLSVTDPRVWNRACLPGTSSIPIYSNGDGRDPWMQCSRWKSTGPCPHGKPIFCNFWKPRPGSRSHWQSCSLGTVLVILQYLYTKYTSLFVCDASIRLL